VVAAASRSQRQRVLNRSVGATCGLPVTEVPYGSIVESRGKLAWPKDWRTGWVVGVAAGFVIALLLHLVEARMGDEYVP
jgi:hypothetical protein